MMEKKELIKKIKKFKHKEIIALAIVIFIFYFLTLSCSFDDEDSILFLRGVREFDIAKWQPHPPGYPVYIFFGKISVFLIKEELLGLTTMSAIFGVLSLVVFYFLILEMFNKKTALMATTILGVTPLFWLNSLQVLTDIAGLFFILLSMYFIYHSIKYKKIKSLYLGSFVSAIAVGVRFHALFVVVPLLIYSYFKMKNKRKIFLVLFIFLLGILIWFIPMIIVNGISEYFHAASKQFLMRFDDPAQATVGGSFNFNYFLSRGGFFLHYFLTAGYGINLLEFNILEVLYLLFFISVLMLSYEKLKNKAVLFFLIALIPNIIITFLFLPPCNPRYLISLTPFISLLFAFGVFGFRKYYHLLFLALFFLLLITTLPLAKEIHTVQSPPTQAINYILEDYENLNNTSIYRDSLLYGYFKINHLDALPYSPKIFLEKASYSNKTILLVGVSQQPAEYLNLTLVKEFKRDLEIAPKISEVYLYRLY